jgi:hypothetical protein
MFTKFKRIVLTISAIFALAAPALVPVAAYAQTNTNISNGLKCGTDFELDTSGNQACTSDASSSTSFTALIKRIINIFSVIIGVVAVIMIIIGGFKYITSGGESSNVSGAKNTIIYAIVGLIVVALAQFIVHFVLAQTSPIGA